jgi:uncharacterized membrane protein
MSPTRTRRVQRVKAPQQNEKSWLSKLPRSGPAGLRLRNRPWYNGAVTRNVALLIGLGLCLAAIASSVWAYPLLPQRVPTHWDLAGNVNGYSSPAFAVTLTPAIMGLIWLFMLVLPAISPRGFRLDESAGAFYLAMLAVIALLLIIHVALLRAALTTSAPSFTLLFASIGALLIVIGSLLGSVKKNFWFGVRTPWTLASDEVWSRTNKLAGRLFVVGGAVVVVASFFGNAALPAMIAVVTLVAIVSIAYSYVVYLRIEGFGPES